MSSRGAIPSRHPIRIPVALPHVRHFRTFSCRICNRLKLGSLNPIFSPIFSMVPCINMPKTLENQLPSAYHHMTLMPKRNPKLASITSPEITIKPLSTMPKAMKGGSCRRNTSFSWSVEGQLFLLVCGALRANESTRDVMSHCVSTSETLSRLH